MQVKLKEMNLQGKDVKGYSMAHRRMDGEGMQFPPGVLNWKHRSSARVVQSL
jgi:hypothetical protein